MQCGVKHRLAHVHLHPVTSVFLAKSLLGGCWRRRSIADEDNRARLCWTCVIRPPEWLGYTIVVSSRVAPRAILNVKSVLTNSSLGSRSSCHTASQAAPPHCCPTIDNSTARKEKKKGEQDDAMFVLFPLFMAYTSEDKRTRSHRRRHHRSFLLVLDSKGREQVLCGRTSITVYPLPIPGKNEFRMDRDLSS